jgi:hypothetical protein
MRALLGFILAGGLVLGCGGADKAALQLRVQALNGGETSSTVTHTTYSLTADQFLNMAIASGPPTSFGLTIKKMELVGSGAQQGAAEVSVPIFESAGGKAISITGSRVDLSDMFTQYDCVDNNGSVYVLKAGESCDCGFDASNQPLGKVAKPSDGGAAGIEVCPYDLAGYQGGRGPGGEIASLEAGAGAFDTLRVVFQRKAKILGCVTGRYNSTISNTGGVHT